ELSAAIELRRRFPGITDQSRPLFPLPCRGLALFDESIQCILQHFAQRHAILCRDGNKRGFNVGPDFGVELRIAPGSVIAATGIDIRHGGTRAYYAEGPDYVQMPPFETFVDVESHAATLAHELTHWTKHEKRLARDMGRIRWGDEGYAKEELVALSIRDGGVSPAAWYRDELAVIPLLN